MLQHQQEVKGAVIGDVASQDHLHVFKMSLKMILIIMLMNVSKEIEVEEEIGPAPLLVFFLSIPHPPVKYIIIIYCLNQFYFFS